MNAPDRRPAGPPPATNRGPGEPADGDAGLRTAASPRSPAAANQRQARADAARSLQGRLDLHFGRAGGRTILADVRRSAPWAVQRLLYLDPSQPALATATLLNTTAGLFAGDHLALSVTVSSGAAVAITTPTQTRAHAMPAGDATLETALRVDNGAVLIYLPEPTLLCRDAALDLRLTLEAGTEAWAICGDLLAFGRAGHGERHAYRHVHQRGEVRRGGRLVLTETLRLSRADTPATLGLTGTSAAYGSLVCLCPEGYAGQVLAALRAALVTDAGMLAGASMLPSEAGAVLRVLAPSAHAGSTLIRRAAAAVQALALHS